MVLYTSFNKCVLYTTGWNGRPRNDVW